MASVSAFALQTSLAAAQNRADETSDIEEIIITGKASQVDLTDPFAGGQVARGGRAGLLGNLDFMDAPFSGTAYTEKLVAAQQAKSIGDVLQNDPVVRVAKGFGNFQELYIIRGFPVFSDDLTLDGVFGILPRQLVAAELVERVEVFRGANAFINGAAPGGSGVGGSINIVPKRAPKDGIRRFTAGYENEGQSYLAADFGARFGADKQWGLRFNTAYRNGETSVDDQDRELAFFSLGSDYEGERLRFSAHIGYQDHRIENPRPQVTPLGEVPDVPEPDSNFAQPGTFSDEEQLFGVMRGEYDLTDQITVWLAAGGRSGEEANQLVNPSAQADGSTTAFRFDNTREDSILSADAGMRARFQTGPVGHQVTVSGSIIDLTFKNAFALSDTSNLFISDLFNPTPLDRLPPADGFRGGILTDPLATEKNTNSSLALADMISLFQDQLILTLGVRFQNIETRSFDFNNGAKTSEFDKSATTPAFGLVYKIAPNLSFYGNYVESLQPGAVAPATSGGVQILNAGEVLDPFRGEQYEIGMKYDGGDFGATLSLFSLTRENAVVIDQLFQASGEQENQGIELSLFGEPVKGLRLIGGASYVDTKLKRTQGGINEGNSVIGVPEFQANLNAEWDVPMLPGLTIDGRVVFTGEQFVNEANSIELASWTRYDLGLRYVLPIENDSITIKGRIENVADKAYWASTGGFPGANFLIQGNPRTFILSASYDF
ncbi:TonB-dependent receptor [Iodidimonas nitroreducens]|nr:TonB-dependent siderophore receptor [Iodidimonas nitroreducens]